MPVQHPIKNSFNAGEWSPLLSGRSDLPEYSSAVSELENFVVQPQGGISRRSGSRYVISAATFGKKSRLIKFEYSIDNAYVLEFTENKIRVFKNGAIIKSGGVAIVITTTYTEQEIFEINFTQSADTFYIVHESHPPAKLIRSSDTAWTLSSIDFTNPAFDPANIDDSITFTVAAVSGSSIQVDSSSAIFSGSIDIGRRIKFQEILSARYSKWEIAKTIAINDYRYYDQNLYIATSAGITDINPPVHLEGTESDGAVSWKYVNSGFGVGKIVSYSSTVRVFIDIESEISPAYLSGYHKWALDQWNESYSQLGLTVNGYPSVICFFEERLWFAGNSRKPQTIWASQSGDYENFTTGEQDDASLEYTIASEQINKIQWMASGKGITIGTVGAEFVLGSSSIEEPVTPTNIKITLESTRGSSDVRPLQVGDSLLFVQRNKRKIRKFQYRNESNSFISSDITLFAEHITESGIVEMDYQREPSDTIYAVREDGILITAAFLEEQAINGWARQITDGEVESVCILPTSDGKSDEIWVSVKRLIAGVYLRYIEVIKMDEEIESASSSKFLDSHVFYDGVPTDTVNGLDHLITKTVSILADGKVLPDVTLTSGSTIIPFDAEVIIAGLPYTSKMTTMNLEAGINPGSSAQGKLKRISNIIVRVFKSIGFKIGSNESNTDAVIFRSSSDSMNEAVPLFTGDKQVPFRSSHETEGQIHIRQDQPLPLTLLALMPKIKTEVK